MLSLNVELFDSTEEKWIESSPLSVLEPCFLIRLKSSSVTVVAMLLFRVMLSGVPVLVHIFSQGDDVTSFLKASINNTSSSV